MHNHIYILHGVLTHIGILGHRVITISLPSIKGGVIMYIGIINLCNDLYKEVEYERILRNAL